MAKIMLIEDEVLIAKLVRMTLESVQHECVHYATGLEGLEALRHTKPDLLLLDINLPDIKGFDILYQMRTDARVNHPPTIMLTAQGDLHNRLQGIEHAQDYITKPFSPQELKLRIQRVLEAQHSITTTAPLTELENSQLGIYSINKKLATSDHAVLYCAEGKTFDGALVLKFFLDSIQEDRRRERFLFEAAVVSKLEHPNIVPIYNVEKTSSGHLFMVMPFIKGKRLRDLMQVQAHLAPAVAVNYAKQLAAGLMCAHKQDIIHRDVKPDNIIVTPEGRVRILDFGVAKLTRLSPDTQNLTSPGMLLGTMTHMAPELLSNSDYDHRIDIWSFGVMLFQMLTGRHPFKAVDGNIISLLHNILSMPLPEEWLSADVPESLRALIRDTLEKDPEQRPGSFEVILNRLALIEQHVPTLP